MESRLHDLGAEFVVNCDTFLNENKVAAVAPVKSVEATCSYAMLALSFSTLLVECMMKILGSSMQSYICDVKVWAIAKMHKLIGSKT